MFYLSWFLVGGVFCNDLMRGWNYINLHCRDDDNAPVDWWVLYKPSIGDDVVWETGQNFTYITSESAGKWNPSDRFVTSDSMLQHTLSPMFRVTYHDYLAVLAYNSRESSSNAYGSAAQGILLADEMGGVWVTHTINGFPDLTRDRLIFPDSEISNGHMIMCMSVSLTTLNEIGRMLKDVRPEVTSLVMPEGQRDWLPQWLDIGTLSSHGIIANAPLKQLDFTTNAKTVKVSMMVRPPGDKRCLYKTFAKRNRIILDVYGHDQRTGPVCERTYSVRNMDAISLKYPESVYYINNKTDRVGFAVSTVGKWKLGSASQYWACTSALENEDKSGRGGLVVCLEDYGVWRSFDLLKIKDPRC